MGIGIGVQERLTDTLVIQRASSGISYRSSFLQLFNAFSSPIFQAVGWSTRNVYMVVSKMCTDVTTYMVYVRREKA